MPGRSHAETTLDAIGEGICLGKRLFLDPRFWSHFFEVSFAKQIEVFCDVVLSRVLPVFDDADTEAEQVAEAEYDRLGSLPGGEYGPIIEMDEAAEMAHEVGLAHYEVLTSVKQALLNLSAAALYHMLEQQLLVFHRRQVLHPREESDPKLSTDIKVFLRRLKEGGLDMDQLASWRALEELRCLANTIKHGEGRSARRLRELRPALFTPPTLHGTRWDKPIGIVSQPLAGEDIYVTVEDLSRYRDMLLAFWGEFGEAIGN